MTAPAQRITFRYRANAIAYQFSVAAPYTEGHCLTANEAQALNMLRSENIRENMRPAFVKATEDLPADAVVPEATVAVIQAQLEEYDANYQFGSAGSPVAKLGAIEREARLLAKARSAEETTEEELELLAQSIDLLAEARQRVEARAKIMATEMEELIK